MLAPSTLLPAEKDRTKVSFYADLVRCMPIALTIWRLDDLGDSESLRLVDANPAATDVVGIDLSLFIGERPPLILPSLTADLIAKLAETARTGKCHAASHANYSDERISERSWFIRTFALPDQCVGLVFEDVSQRAEIESQNRRMNEELESRVEQRTADLAAANRDLRQKNQENEMFVYSVSHDLRSPLVSLQGFSKELGVVGQELQKLLINEAVPAETREAAARLIDGDMQQSLKFIQAGVLRLSTIIDALLRLSRLGRVEYEIRRQDAERTAKRVAESMAAALQQRAIAVTVLPLPSCQADGAALDQIFANLLENAVKYSDSARPNGIEIGSLAEPSSDIGGNVVTYYVKDQGLGIAAAHQEKIFQAFQRAHPRHAPGDGMGLAFVRRMVERHGGKVWVESVVNEGSTFFFTLPAAEAAAPEIQKGGPSVERKDGHFVG